MFPSLRSLSIAIYYIQFLRRGAVMRRSSRRDDPLQLRTLDSLSDRVADRVLMHFRWRSC